MKKDYSNTKGEIRYTTCTTGGPVFVYVKNGKIVRVTPIHFNKEEVKPWSIEAGNKVYTPPLKYSLTSWGSAMKQWIYSPNRVKYPLKRIDWNHKGKRNAENRGKSEYVRISWDEAWEILTNEIKYMMEVYGPSTIMTSFTPHPEWGSLNYFFSDYGRFWNILGHTVRAPTPASWEGWISGAAFMYGHFKHMGILPSPDSLRDISQNSSLIILWGTDPISHAINFGSDHARPFLFWKELGKKIICIDPYGNDTGMLLADKWMPIIPGTDAALAAAIAYIWIEEGTFDQEYLDTHTIGFDEDHLPSEAPEGSSFKNYILGICDHLPKTPIWAEQITGIPSRTIVELAREWADKPTALVAAFSGACRRAYAHEWTRFMVTLQAMQGLGKPGVSLISIHMNLSGPYDKRQVGLPGYAQRGMNFVAETLPKNPVRQIVPLTLIDECMLNPPFEWRGGAMGPSAIMAAAHREPELFKEQYQYPAKDASEVHMIWMRGSSFGCPCDFNGNIRVFQSPTIETIVIQNPWFDRSCKFADIVLPVSLPLEKIDVSEPGKAEMYIPPTNLSLRCAIYHQKGIEPVGESKSDLEIYTELARRLGVDDKYNEGNTEEDWLKKIYSTSEIPMSYDEFKKKGYYVWPFLDDYKPSRQLQGFYEDPIRNPLETPSGKIEIFSLNLFRDYGANNPEIPPVPHYIPEWEGKYSKPLIDKYPLQLLTPHPKIRFHGKYDDLSWFREIYKVKGPDGYEYEPIIMNPIDAEYKGLNDKDIVRVFNDRGQILCGVITSQRILKGVVMVAYGSWFDLLESKAGALDRGGESNMLTPSKGMSEHYIGTAVNSALVEVEKADLEKLKQLYPEKFI